MAENPVPTEMMAPAGGEAAPARSLRGELRRLSRGFAHRVGRRRARRIHITVLVVAMVLAFVSRALWDVPGIALLEDRWGPTLFAASGLIALGPALALLLGSVVRPARAAMAYQLDDRLELQDQAGTATETLDQAQPSPLVDALRTHAADRLRRTDPDRLWKHGRHKVPYLRGLLVLLFVFFLIAPGVDGLFGDRGVGRGEDSGIGPRDVGSAPGRKTAMPAKMWLAWFAQDPMPVEALGEASDGDPDGAADAGGGDK